MRPRRAAPYPYERWPALSRSEAAAASALARIPLHAEGSRAARMIEAIASAIRAELRVTASAAQVLRRGQLSAPEEPRVAVALLERHDGVDRALVLELTVELAGVLVERALGGAGGVRPHGLGLDELELGALGYLAARACAATGGRLRVASVTTDGSRWLDALGPEALTVLTWPLELELESVGGHARVLLSPEATRSLATRAAPPRRFDVPSAWLGLPIALCAHAATVRLTAGELSQLAPGDAVFPDRTALSHRDGGWYGEATLHALGRPNGPHARCTLEDRGLRVAAIEPGEQAMIDDDNPQALVSDAPIELCVEMARFTLRLEDVLGLRAGEVLHTGRAIGERVVLTANGRAVARGELVDLEGDIGVRILETHQ